MRDITCPGGLCGRVRGIKVAEQKILTDRALLNKGLFEERLIETCWVETLDMGLYERQSNGQPNWAHVLQGERFYAFMQIVIETYGPIWEFEVPCQYCRARMAVAVNLEELKVQKLPIESAKKIKAGENRFECILPESGAKVWFRLLTGAEQRRIPRMQEDMEDQIIGASLALKIIEIEGVDVKDKLEFIEQLGLRDATEVAELFEEPDCGVDSNVEVSCGRCKAEQGVNVPFGMSFVLRSGVRGRRKRLKRKGRRRSYQR